MDIYDHLTMKYNFLIVALGASAGGLKALTDFFSHVNAATPVAYVIAVHSPRDYKSQLPAIISRFTSLDVLEIHQGLSIEATKIYVCPPAMMVSVRDGVFLLRTRPEIAVTNETINHLFRSLAADASENAVGIIMSGTGSDGTKGLQAIEERGGITIVQDPATAEFDGMPNHSIRFDHPDMILAPNQMAAALHRHAESKFSSIGKLD